MPLLITPYTLGSFQGAAGAAAAGGAGYYLRRKKFVAYIMSCLVLVLL